MAYNLAKFTGRFLLRRSALICRQASTATSSIKFTPVALLKSKPVLFGLSKMTYATDKLHKDQIEDKVLEILRNFDRVKENPAKPKVTLESHLAKDLGLDSLDQVEIIVQIEDAFGFEIPDSDYEKLLSPNEIVNYVVKRGQAI